MTALLRILKKNKDREKMYQKICYEVTHHGPFMQTPTLFVEVGSTKEEWDKIKPAEIVAKSVNELLEKYMYEEDLSDDIPVLIGIGGGHYAPRFSDVVFEKKAAFGHMIPTYHINDGNVDSEMIKKAIDATPNAQAAYIHKKSLKKSQVTEYRNICNELDITVISSKELEYL